MCPLVNLLAVVRVISKMSVIEMGRRLELFSGTGSIGLAFKEILWDVVSVDIHDRFKPDITADILLWDYTVFPPCHFDVIWSSPPCTEYSCAKTVGIRDLVAADALVTKVL